MHAFHNLFVIIMLFSNYANAYDLCEKDNNKCYNTTLGKLEITIDKHKKNAMSFLYLNGVEIFSLEADNIGIDPDGWTLNKEKKMNKMIIWYRYNKPKILGPNDYLYGANIMLDLSKGDKAVISNEFYPPGYYDAQIDWISWGKKNSVIAFKDGSRFRHQDGLVTMIDDGGHTQSKGTATSPNAEISLDVPTSVKN